MSLIKRATTTLFAKIDQVIGDIENHDALIKATIKDQQHKLAQAKVQYNKVANQHSHILQQLIELEARHRQWTTRALEVADNDESKALACLQRRQAIEVQQQRLKQAAQEYQATLGKMEADINACEQEIKSISHKHQLMKARQSSVDARNAIHHEKGLDIEQINESFDRWQVSITEGEIALGQFQQIDTLEHEFETVENEQALRDELAALKRQSQQQE